MIALRLLPLLISFQTAGSPAETRLNALISALNSKSKETIQAFVHENMAPSFLEAVPESDQVSRLLGLSQQVAPLAISSFRRKEAAIVVANLKPVVGPEVAITLQVESQPPHRITGVRLGPPPEDSKLLNLAGWKSLADLAKMTREQGKLPAIGLAVAKPTGKIESVVAGEKDAETHAPVSRSDRWWIGSVTKSMTATVVARLIEQGKLRWDETLAEALPDVRMLPAYQAATLEQVMQHRAGLPQDLRFRGETVEKILGGERDPFKMRARYVADILQREPIGAPGPSRYSNAGYAILSHIVERTTGKPFEDTMRELLFEPLGMKSALVPRGDEPGLPDSDKGIHGHTRQGDALQVRRFVAPDLQTITAGAGGVAMTVGDLARYGRLHLRGLQGKDGLLKAETIRRLHKAMGTDLPYASGWMTISNLPTGPFQHHNGGNGSAQAELAIWPDRGLVVASITNLGFQEINTPTLQAAIALAQQAKK